MEKFLFLLCAVVVPVAGYSKPVIDDYDLMKKAVNTFLTIYKNDGMEGATLKIENCYKNKQQKKLYCFYLDYTARIVDSTMIEYLNKEYDGNFKTRDYLSNDNFGKRSFKYVYKPNDSDFDEANSHLNYIYYQIIGLIEANLISSVR